MKTFKTGNKNIILNSNLINTQHLSNTDVVKIEKLHYIKNCFFDIIEKEVDKTKLKSISKLITQIEFQLQKVWKFSQDEKYHKFWEIPGCNCPKLDNEDVYGTGHRYINPNCVFHGK